MNNPEPAKRWHCRERVEMDTVMRNGQSRSKVWHDLVYGYASKNKNGNDVVIGETYHSLDGPTGKASIASFAEDYNLRQVPPTSAPVFKPANNKNDPNQFSLPLVGSDLNLTKKGRK
jgi:hypothetical protein